MFLNGNSEDAVGEVSEAAANDATTAVHLNMADDSWQTKLVRLSTQHVASLDQQAELFHPSRWMSLLNDVTVCTDNYHRRVWCTGLRTHRP